MTPPHASAEIKGSTDYPDIRGFMRLYQTRNGVNFNRYKRSAILS